MARKSKKKPSFFKVLSNKDFTKLLRLPPAFLRRYELDLSENVKIGAAYSRRKWNVKVERMENNGLFCFTDGWPKFVEDADLQLEEFLVFFQVEKSKFDVIIYDTSCCERRIPPPPPPPPPPSPPREEASWRFIKKLKEYNLTDQRLDVPQKFAVVTGIGRKRETVLEDWHGVKWSVSVMNRNRKMFSFCRGWMAFVKANRLRAGTYLLFEYIAAQQVVKVVAMETRVGKKLLQGAEAEYGGFLRSSTS